MKTIINNVSSKTEINKSKFYCYIFKINNKNDIIEKIELIKKQYKDATHYCYAYILDNAKKFSDDGEPSKTAGMPILNVLEKKELDHVLCIVVRYFGGIKLGAGGLIRAYTNSVVNTISDDNIKELHNGFKIKITFSYDNLKYIDNLLSNYDIEKSLFEEDITYIFYITENDFKKIETNLKNKCKILEKIENILL